MRCNGAPSSSSSLVVIILSLLSAILLSSGDLLPDVINKIPELLNPGGGSSSGETSSSEDSPQAYLDAHNAVRKAVGEAPLVWNNTLASYAESYANKRKDCEMVHSDGPYGENLAMSSGGDLSATAAVKLWTDENKEYHHDTISPDMTSCLHYTQVVWSGTTSLGCAKVQCADGKSTFIICSYYPAGNVIGEKPY